MVKWAARYSKAKVSKPVMNMLYSTFILFIFVAQAMIPFGAMSAQLPESDELTPMGSPTITPMQGDYPPVSWEFFFTPDSASQHYSADFYDVNMDGNLDIILGSLYGINIWENDGNGIWTPYTAPSASGYSLFKGTACGDFNNDGKPDLVSAHSTGAVAWTGDGNGNWTLSNNGLVTGKMLAMHDIVLEDINLDGNLDIAVSGIGKVRQGGKKAITVFEGDGAGSWTSKSSNLPKLGTHYGLDIGDFNKDGKLDIATANTQGIDAWINGDNGTWILSDVGLPAATEYADVKFADLNYDGNLDIVATSNGNLGIGVWNGDGNGTWAQSTSPAETGYYSAVEIADLNHDGYLDIMTSSRSSNDLVWTGDGMDNWFLQSNISQGVYDMNVNVAIADLDHDADLEICMVNLFAGVHIYSSSVNRTITNWSSYPAPQTSAIINDIEVFDLNLDGKQDIVYATESNGAESWLGSGGITWTSWPSYTGAGALYGVEADDFNKDAWPDLILAGDTGIYAVTGNAAGAWTDASGSLPSGSWYSIEIADFNHDGSTDIAAGSGNGAGIEIYDGTSSGSWNFAAILSNNGTFYDLCIGDVNRDGNLDIIGADGGLRVFLGDGADGWTEDSTGLPSSPGSYMSVELADIDNNGALDIIGSSTGATGTNTWLNDGNGQWTQWGAAVDDFSNGLAVADFSIDGFTDICTGSYDSSTGLSGFKQDGGSWLSISTGLAQIDDYTCLELADINFDGLLDIITTNGSAAGASIWAGYMPLPDKEDPATWNVNLNGVSNFSVNFSEASIVNLTAIVDDTNRGYSQITSALFTETYAFFPGTQMYPADGAFDNYVEEVNYTLDIDMWDAGIYDFFVYGTDKAGYDNTTSTENATLEIIDDVPPEILFPIVQGGLNYTVLQSEALYAKITVVISDDLTGGSIIGGANMTIGEMNWNATLPFYSIFGLDTDKEGLINTLDLSGWLPGVYDLYVYANDTAGNLNLTSQTVLTITIINDAAPEIYDVLLDGSSNITIPLSAASTVNLTGTLSDWGCGDTLIGGANYTMGFVDWATSTPMLPVDALDSPYENFTSTIDISTWDVGVYDFYMYGWDVMNCANDTSAEHATLTIYDDMAPVVENVNAEGLTVYEVNASVAGLVNIKATINDTGYGDNLIGGANVTIGLDNWPSTEMFASDALDTPTEEFWYTFDISAWVPGVYYIYAYGWDIDMNYDIANTAYATIIIHDDLAPDIYDVQINGSTTFMIGDSEAMDITLTAVADDMMCGGADIGGANYTIGYVNWPSSPINPSDGAFDSPVENLDTIIDISTWPPGTYELYVYGWDVTNYTNGMSTEFATLIIYDDMAPDIYDVRINGSTSFSVGNNEATEISLAAVIDDTLRGGADIGGGNYTIGYVNWPASSMYPTDGAFDSPSENINATIDISSWPPGTYEFYVYGWDATSVTNETSTAHAVLIILDDSVPDIYDARINGSASFAIGISQAAEIILTATIDDTLRGGANIGGANYTIGQLNWPSNSMYPTDGAFDAPLEDLNATIDISTWPPGTYELYVYGWDADNYANDTSIEHATLTIYDDMAPVVEDVSAQGMAVYEVNASVAGLVNITATVNDAGYGNNIIGGANITIGQDNWPSTAMIPDGTLDSLIEGFWYTFDISAWVPGVYFIYAYGWDDQMNHDLANTAFATIIIHDDMAPDIYDVRINGSATFSIGNSEATEITLTAVIDDTMSGGANIGGANYTIGYISWPASPIFPTDGAFDSPLEDLNTTIDISAWPPGTYELYVYGWDDTLQYQTTSLAHATLTITDNQEPAVMEFLINGVDYLTTNLDGTGLFTVRIDDTGRGGSIISSASLTDGYLNWPSQIFMAGDTVLDTPNETFSISLDFGNMTAGIYEFFVYGSDSLGNQNLTSGAKVTVEIQDNKAPATLDFTTTINGATEIWVSPAVTPMITLNATVSDELLGNSNVTAVNYTVGSGNWIDSWMLPVDGTFDNFIEDATALIDISSWPGGTYHIYVYGTDAYGNGQVSTVQYVIVHIDNAGPETVGPWADGVEPILFTSNNTFELTAYGDEFATGGANVMAAEYFIDAIGPDGTGIPMSPMDAGFDSSYEGANELVNVSAWAEGESHTFYVHFQDALGEWGFTDSVTVFIINGTVNSTHNIAIHLGWNLISLPCIPFISDTQTALDDSSGDGLTTWDKVQWYDASDLNDHWKTFDIHKPAILNDLLTIDNTMGLWINITNIGDGFLQIAGLEPPATTNIMLYAGWNLVGYPTLNNSTTIEVAFFGTGAYIVEVCNISQPYLLEEVGSTYIMQPGEGYWVKVPVDTVWTVNSP